MINFSIFLSNSSIIGPGGLFDFDATLPAVMIQFLILIFILNILLYKPLLLITEKRQEYIVNNLSEASELLTKTNELLLTYEQKLTATRKQAQLEITNSQKIHKEKLEHNLSYSQTQIDTLLNSIMHVLSKKKNLALINFENIIESLCLEIKTQLLI